jgi:hypothetical protein
VSRPATGTLAWARATGGALDRRARFEQLRQAIVARLGTMTPATRREKGLAGRRLDLPEREPDSELCRAALELCREISPPALTGHSLRTWLFSALFASRDRVAYDEEVLYVACLLHDIGLTPDHWQQDEHARCFAVEGAFAAERFCYERGVEDERAERISEAIVAHLNVHVPLECSPETHLLHEGVALDAIGRGVRGIDPAAVATVIERYPREGVVEALSEPTRRQAKIRPESRVGLFTRFGFQGMVRANPLNR